jgi:hypothetical protein
MPPTHVDLREKCDCIDRLALGSTRGITPFPLTKHAASALSARILRTGSTAFTQQWSRETSDAASPILAFAQQSLRCLRYALSGKVIVQALTKHTNRVQVNRADVTQRRSPVAGLSGGGGK